MNQVDAAKLTEFLEKEQWDKAKELLDGYMRSLSTEDAKGEAYLGFAALYMDVNNKVNRRYEQALDDAIATLKDIKSAEKKAKNEVDIARVSNKIAKK